MNRSDLTTRVLIELGESSTAPIFWDTDEIHTVLQDAQESMAERIGGIKRTAMLSLEAGAMFYPLRALAPDLLKLTRIWSPSRDMRLTAVTRDQLDRHHELWRTVQGSPENYLSMGYDWIGVWPIPDVSGILLRIDYTAWPRTLDSESDWPEFLEPDHETIVRYGVYDGLMKRWDIAQAVPVFMEFEARLGLGHNRSGTEKMKARNWQKGSAPAASFRSNVRTP